MTRRRSSPLGLELVLSVVLALVVLPLLSHGAPVQESHADLQRYSEGCYYNYNHYSEGDRILTNEPCLNCTCHNKMLMCYLRVCPFTKPIGHDCTVEKREDQCCPIVTCPEVPVDIAHHSNQLTTSAPGTELSIPEKYGCSIDNKFYVEGAQVPSNPNKPCELCYCIRNRTACLMQECTLHIDGCQPIYNKGSCCPVRYNCDHENELLEIEDFSTTTTTVRPTEGYILPSTTSPTVTTDCTHNNEIYADGASITGKSSCEHCYCMRGDIVCAVRECEMPTLESGAKTCRALPPAAGECCPSNYVCDDDSVTTEVALTEDRLTTITPIIQSNLHESVSQEDVQLQEHIDDKISVTEVPAESVEQQGGQKDEITPTTIIPIAGETSQPSEEGIKDSEEEEEKPLLTTVSAIKETVFETTHSPIEQSTTHKTEEGFESSHKDKEDESTHPPKEDEIIDKERVEEDTYQVTSTIASVVGDKHNLENDEEVLPTKVPDSSQQEETTLHSLFEEEKEDKVPSKEEDVKPDQAESTTKPEETAEKDESATDEIKTPELEPEVISSTTLTSIKESQDMDDKIASTESSQSADTGSESEASATSVPTKEDIESEEIGEKDESSTEVSKPELETVPFSSSTLAPVEEPEDVNKTSAPEVTPHIDSASEAPDAVTSVPSKPHIEPQETSSESVDFSEESTPGQEEIQDKIDEDISEPSSESSTSSPAYEVITESDNIHIGMPEIGDHKTESDLPKKKPKDEPEPVESITTPPDVTEDEILHTVDSSTSKPSADSEIPLDVTKDEIPQTVDATTPKPSVESDESDSSELATGKPEQSSDESTEIPATEEEITEASSKPVSGDVLDEKDIPHKTTALPHKDENVDDVIGSQEKEDGLSTESAITDKQTTTSRPVRIHIDIDGEEEVSDITTMGTEKELVDSTTSIPSIVDSSAAVTEREEEDIEPSTDYTSSAPSVIDSEKPSEEGIETESELDTTMKVPSATDGAVSSSEEEELKPEKETVIPKGESSTPTPSKASETEHELSTIVPTDIDTTSAGEEVEGKPQTDIDDLTTAVPLIEESEEQHVEEEQDKTKPEHDIHSTSIPTIADSDQAVVEEEEHKKATEQSLADSTTKHPSAIEKEETGSEEDVTKGKPLYDSTEAPVDNEATSVDVGSVQQDPELVIDSTTTPSESKPDTSSNEEDVEGEPEIDTNSLTTINPIIADSGISHAEEDIHKTPGQEILTSTVSTLPVDEEINEKEPIIHETLPTISSVDESGTTARSETEKQTEQSIIDSTTKTTALPTADESQSSEDHTQEHETPASEDKITHAPSVEDISDSSTIIPSVDVSGEEVKEEAEDVLGDLTTVSPLTSDSEGPIGEEIKKQPEQELIDSSTKSPVASETFTTKDHEEKIQQTTTGPSLADSKGPIVEEEMDKDHAIIQDGFSTDTPSLVEENQEIPTTAIPQRTESEQASEEDLQDKQPIDKHDVIETSPSSIEHADKESSESTDKIEGSGIPMHDIIPSAIPGEGDCLANGHTFANNATVPTSSECELSCACINSIIVCKRVQCIEPPTPNNCVLDEASTDKCCPQYICGIDSFAEDPRPTSPEEIEDEEIQFTTWAPSHKYPDISTESATSTQKLEEEELIGQDESSKTELPVSSDENTTPLSMDFEQPALTPEDPMSHVKADEAQETSTKHSGEDIFVEGSTTTTTQPITVKPTKQVTGDIEQPIEVTPSVPEYSIPSKEPEAITTLGATDDEEEQKATTPKYQELPSTEDTATDSEKPVIPEEEISTDGALEKETTTRQPIKEGASSEAPPVPAIIHTDDSTQSEETPETSDEGSNESEEETDSEEDTKIPMLHKEEDQQITTSRPLVSEHVGDIEPIDESTGIPEIDYPKPEMPEDLSHTKIEDETLLEKEKPAKPIESGELESNQESEESSEKITTTPASTILTRVEPTDDDKHNIDASVGTSDIPSSESDEEKPHGDKPISSTITPIKSEEEPYSETATESKKDKTETQTSLPVPFSGDESNLEKDQVPSQTISPIAGNITPEKESESSEDTKPSTSAPATEEHSIEGSGAEDSEEDSEDKKHDVVSSTSTPTIDQTLTPVHSHESSEEKDEIPSHTIAPSLDGHIPTAENEETSSQTSAPSIEEQSIEGSGSPISEDKSDIEQNEIANQTSVPVIDKEQPSSESDEENKIDVTSSPAVEEHSVEGSGAPTLGDKSEQDEIISQTSTPAIEKQPSTSDLEDEIKIDNIPTSPSIEEHSVEGSSAPISEDKTDLEQDDIVSHTTGPTIDKQPSSSDLEDDIKIDVTSSPALGEGSGSAVSDDKTDVEQDEIAGQTSTPAIEKQTPISDLEEENKIDVTSSPAIEEHSVEGSGAPISEDKTDVVQDEIASQTTVPSIEKQPSISDLEDEVKIDVTSSPAVEEGGDVAVTEDIAGVEQDEFASQTTVPSIKKQPSISDSEEEIKIDVTSSPAVEEGSGTPVSLDKTDIEQDEIISQTSSPAIDQQPTISSVEDEHNIESFPAGEEHSVEGSGLLTSEEDVAHKEHTDTQTRDPISEDELIKFTVAPVSEDEAHSVTPSITNTIAPVLETDTPNVSVPSSEEEADEEKTSIESQTDVPSHDLDDKITPIIPTTEKESHDSTSSSEEGEDVASGHMPTVAGDKYEETELPEDTKPTVLVPISEEENESELTTVSTDVKDDNLDASKPPAGSIPTKDMETSEENIDATDAPSKDTSAIVSGDEYIGATESSASSTPVHPIEEEKETSEEDTTTSTIIPIKSVDAKDEILDSTELPSSSSSAKPIESVDEPLEATEHPQVDFDKEHTSEEASSTGSESASPVTVSTPKLDEEVFSQTQAPVSSDSASEEEVSISQTGEPSSDEEQHIDKTLITTESALPASETVSPSEIEESGSEDKLDQTPTDKPSTQTKHPELMGEETSTKAKDESEDTKATEMPDIISSHEVHVEPSEPESDHQILVEDIATAKPAVDVVPTQTEISADEKEPSVEVSQTTTRVPAVIDESEAHGHPDVSETHEHPETPESVEEESSEETGSKVHEPVVQTEIPASVTSEQGISSEDVDKMTTGKPIDNSDSSESTEEIIVTKSTTIKPADDVTPTKSEEEDDVEISSTVVPVDQQSITSSPVDVHVHSDHTSSTDKSEEEEEENEHTETPKDDTKIQTIGEFVTERSEDLTTALPNEDKENISEQPISPELPETATQLTEEEKEKEKPEVSITTESVLPISSSEESEEKIQLPAVPTEIAVDKMKPQAQPGSTTEESEEKTQAPEITSDISDEDHKPHVHDTVVESEEKTQAPEIQPEIIEEDHKQHVQPTEGAITPSSSDKPITPTLDEKIDSELPKPLDTDDKPSSVDETPLSTTIHPLFPHSEHDRTTSAPQLNATDKIDHEIPASASPSVPTTDQPTSQAATNAPTSHYQPPGYGQVPPQYPSYTEDEYTDEDETEVFGPGTCRYGGKLFVSAQQIPRDDPCDFCFCFRSDIICLQQSCPPPISGCHEEPISGFCCPRYECPVSMATTLNITTSTTTTSTTLPPHFLHHAYRGAAAKNGCHISGKSYKVGDKIDSASGPCMHCTCGGDGQMKCDPKTCSPEPMLRQMIAVVASRRR